MNPAKLNKPRGTVPCPMPECTETAQVFQYRGRPNELQRRRAGKWYLRCPSCGNVDCTGQRMQDWILEKITWAKDTPSDAAADSRSAPAPTPAPAKPRAAPAPKQPEAPASQPAPPTPAPAQRLDVWNL